MSINEMHKIISAIHEQIMFEPTVSANDYSELLAAVEELQYFLKIDLHVPPINVELPTIDSVPYTF